MKRKLRPVINPEEFDKACELANLTDSEQKIIDYIRFKGVFTQPGLTKELGLRTKPPVLSILCEVCRKIGNHIPEHFDSVREWSKSVSEDKVRWDGNLICCIAMNIDGEKLVPESGTALYHTFAVHKELFQGLD